MFFISLPQPPSLGGLRLVRLWQAVAVRQAPPDLAWTPSVYGWSEIAAGNRCESRPGGRQETRWMVGGSIRPMGPGTDCGGKRARCVMFML